MNYELINNNVVVHNVTALNLAETLDCGQSFRWVENSDKSFTGVAYGKVVTVRLEGTDFIIETLKIYGKSTLTLNLIMTKSEKKLVKFILY